MSQNTTSRRDVPGAGTIEVRRSVRRRRTVTAFREAGQLVVAIPATFTPAQEEEWIERMVAKVRTSELRRQLSSDDLEDRALRLAETYLPSGVRPTSVRWVTNQSTRWGSCTPATGTIRISHRMRNMPAWVVDYVLVHELAHLLVPDHSEKFWRIVTRYPEAERARGFLKGVAYAHATAAGDADYEGDIDDVD